MLNSQFCAGSLSGGTTAPGDSGGPALTKQWIDGGEQWQLIGIVSGGFQFGNPFYVFVAHPDILQWINSFDHRNKSDKTPIQFEVYVKVGEDDTTLTFGQGTSEEPRAEVAENIKAQLEKKYGEGKVSQQRGNKFTVPASPSPPSPTPPDDGLSGGRNEISA